MMAAGVGVKSGNVLVCEEEEPGRNEVKSTRRITDRREQQQGTAAAAAVEGGAHVRGVPSQTNVTAGERRGKGNYTHGHLVIRE
jgi:hypothetical protein